METIYVLMSDSDGTTFSCATPFGFAVRTEEEAKKFIKRKFGFLNSYEKIEVCDTVDEALINWEKDENRK